MRYPHGCKRPYPRQDDEPENLPAFVSPPTPRSRLNLLREPALTSYAIASSNTNGVQERAGAVARGRGVGVTKAFDHEVLHVRTAGAD